MRSPLADLLDDLGASLAAVGVRWYLFGAQAAIFYGAARLTADVDVTIKVPAGLTTRAIIDALEAREFVSRMTDVVRVEQTRVLPVVHGPTGLPVDLVLAGPGIEDEFLAHAVVHVVDGVRVPVAAATDLIVMKVLAGRPKDLDDVEVLMRTQGAAVDLGRARAFLAALESALGQSDLVPVLERILARTQRPES